MAEDDHPPVRQDPGCDVFRGARKRAKMVSSSRMEMTIEGPQMRQGLRCAAVVTVWLHFKKWITIAV